MTRRSRRTPNSASWSTGQYVPGGTRSRTATLSKSSTSSSTWCNQRTGEVPLRQGEDFDDVVLAIPVGAFKPLNAAPGPCAELIAASTRFKKMTDAASLAPTISVQAWCVPSLAELGWPPQGLASAGSNDYPLSCGPPPLSIWADRTVVLDYEHWPQRPPPGSLQYLCDTFETSLYKEPPECTDTPHKAHCHAVRLVVKWLEERSRVLWPAANPNDVFDWNVLYDPEGRCGADRIHYQVVKANVDPSACCTGSPAGSTRWRCAPIDPASHTSFSQGPGSTPASTSKASKRL